MVVRRVALTRDGRCFLCESPMSPALAWRISWEHLEICGPAMIKALREREQPPAKTKKRLGGQNR